MTIQTRKVGLNDFLHTSTAAGAFASGASDFSESWAQQIREMLAGNPDTADYSVLHLDHEKSNLPMSTTLVCVPISIQEAGKKDIDYAVTFTLCYENVEVLVNRQENIAGVPVSIHQVTSDIYTTDFITGRIKPIVEKTFAEGESSHIFYDAGFNYVLADMNVGTPEEITKAIRKKVHLMVTAIETQNSALSQTPHGVDITDRPTNVSLRTQFNPIATEVLDSNNIPVRADYSIAVVVASNQQQGQQANLLNQSSTSTLVTAHGYVDVIENPQRKERATSFSGSQLPPFTLYSAVVVLTAIRSAPNAGESLGLWMLGIAANALLNEDRRWANMLDPRKHVTASNNMRDVASLTLKYQQFCNVSDPQRLDTRSNTFDKAAYIGTILNPMFDDRPFYAIDIQRGGDHSWLASIVAVLANPEHPRYSAALALWINTADTLFNGEYTKVLAARAAANGGVSPLNRLFSDTNSPAHVGYFIGEGGKRVPFATIDNVSIGNLFPNDQAVAEEFASTFNPSIPKEIRLEKRLRVPQSVAGATKVVDYATRYMISPELIASLVQCCANKGVTLAANDVEGYSDFNAAGSGFTAPFATTAMNSDVFTRTTQNGTTSFMNNHINWN